MLLALLLAACTSAKPDSGDSAAVVTCEYDGVVYQVGDTWDAGDCANTCTCEDDGVPSCTDLGCP
jgi:hypothetical protein